MFAAIAPESPAAAVPATPLATCGPVPPAALDAPRLLQWAHTARIAVATAILAAALWAWDGAVPADTRTAALAFAGAATWTGVALVVGREWSGRALRAGLAVQVAVDLVLATAAVHVTGGAASQFAALYVLGITEAALLLPAVGALLAAAAACALYSADVLWWRPSLAAGMGGSASPGITLLLQLGVFAAVAIGSGLVGARLQEAGVGRERLAAALVRARVEATDVLRHLPSGVLTVDVDGRLLFANPAASAILGLPSDALPPGHGCTLADVARVAPDLADLLARAARTGERTTRAEGTVTRADGSTTTIGVTTIGVTTSAGDGPPGTRAGTAIFSDITASKRVAALHLRAGRLEAVAELAASLAHEIRNPLASIRSAVEQLARLATRGAAATPDDADDVRTLAALTVRESDRLSRLLGEFLDFSRARVTRLERLDLAAAVRAAARLAAAHPDAAGVRVEVRTAESLGTGEADGAVDADAELLHRAVFNLVLNAAQAARGAVDVEVGVAPPADPPPGPAFARGALAVRVCDDGPGIPPAVADRLFDPFVTTKPGGSGLGLAVVQRAVEAHGGVVHADGGGEGAVFTLLLPRARNA